MKKPRYFCEHCGAEVRRDARLCPRCGRFFSSVKCPKCGNSGRVEDFREGCPACGYADPMNAAPEALKPPPVGAPPLPFWTYLAAFAAFAAILALLLRAAAS